MKKIYLIVLSLACISSKAAIVYTDVNPDKVLLVDFMLLDIDGDGTDDIHIENWSGTNPAPASPVNSELGPTSTGEGIAGAFDSNTFEAHADVLTSGTLIGPSLNYVTSANNGGNTGLAYVISDPWVGQNNQYVGFYITISGNIHYGWMEVSLGSTSYETTIHGYAYEDVPGVAIAAGDMGVSSVGNITGNDVELSVFPNPSNDFINIHVTDQEIKSIEILSIQGDLVATINKQKTKIDVSDLAKGVYLIQLTTSSGITTEKFIKN